MCASINPIPFQPLLRFDFKPGKPASQVWLALQMMFFPIDFVGIPARPIVPSCFGLPINGWQGIVPRKAEVMARRACDRMIGNIVTIEDGWSTAGPRQVLVGLSLQQPTKKAWESHQDLWYPVVNDCPMIYLWGLTAWHLSMRYLKGGARTWPTVGWLGDVVCDVPNGKASRISTQKVATKYLQSSIISGW